MKTTSKILLSLVATSVMTTAFAAAMPAHNTSVIKTSITALAPTEKNNFFYVGIIGGYANVDWNSTVAQDELTKGNTPTVAEGQGALFGGDFGYQFNKHFALEAEYMRMPSSYIQFTFPYLHLADLTTSSNMDFYALTMKFIAPIGQTPFSFFADAGPAYQYRTYNRENLTAAEASALPDKGTWAPTFGGGFLYRLDTHWQGEASFQYAPGTGSSIGFPLTTYIPEVYAATFKLDYLF